MEHQSKLALHAIIIKKPVDVEEAEKVARHFIKDKKKIFLKETSKTLRFRNIPKTKFKPKSYKTKIINDKVSIIVGELKPEHEHLEGSGLLDFFKKGVDVVKSGVNKVVNVFKPRNDSYNNTTRKNLEQYGNLPVKNLTIYRTPIMKILDKALNFISLGKFGELKKKYGFDQLYHLALVANVGGKHLVIEKNEVINVNTSFKTDKKTEIYDVPLDKSFSVNDMLEKGRKNVGDGKWFSYDAFSNNCQFFIKYCLEAEHLYSKEAADFLFQDLKDLAKELPSYVKHTAKAITTTGAIVNKLTGQGEASEDFIKYVKKRGGNKDMEELFHDWKHTKKGKNHLKKVLGEK